MGVCASLAACLNFLVCLCLLCFEANKYDDYDDGMDGCAYDELHVESSPGNTGEQTDRPTASTDLTRAFVFIFSTRPLMPQMRRSTTTRITKLICNGTDAAAAGESVRNIIIAI